MPKEMQHNKTREKLGYLIEENLRIFPVVARKMIVVTKVKSQSTYTQIQNYVLEMLIAGPARPTEISRVLSISKPNVTVMINALIGSGYAQRSHDEKDRRNIFISITDKGRRVVQRRRKIVTSYIMRVFDKLNDDEIKSLCEGMEIYLDVMKKMDKAIGPVV